MTVPRWLDANPFGEAALGSLLLAVVGLLAVSPALPDSGWGRIVRSRWVFAAFIVVTVLAARWPSMTYHLYLGLDEAQMTAQAITLRHHPVPWIDYDGTTSGPLNTAILVIPALFAAPIGFLSDRLIEAALFRGTLAFLFLMTRALYGEPAARVGILLPLAFFCFARR